MVSYFGTTRTMTKMPVVSLGRASQSTVEDCLLFAGRGQTDSGEIPLLPEQVKA